MIIWNHPALKYKVKEEFNAENDNRSETSFSVKSKFLGNSMTKKSVVDLASLLMPLAQY